jgi:putative Mg2+ transporter-C (MgtC) family protein
VKISKQPKVLQIAQEYAMPTTLTWSAIALRLLLTAVCAGVIGFNRDQKGHSAGLRTTILVGLAASLAMVQTNWLINSNGKPQDSFVVMDIMRLPLGILSGIGFIGAGAIIKRGELVAGVTTAATIWFVTVMGLCFGGGQIGLGLAGFVLGLLTLTSLKRVELHLTRQHRGTLKITVSAEGLHQNEVASLLIRSGLAPAEPFVSFETSPSLSKVFGWKIRWKGEDEDPSPPRVLEELAAYPGVLKLELTR